MRQRRRLSPKPRTSYSGQMIVSGGGGPTSPASEEVLLNDTFTDADNTPVTEHTPEVDVYGLGWQTASTGDDIPHILADQVQPDADPTVTFGYDAGRPVTSIDFEWSAPAGVLMRLDIRADRADNTPANSIRIEFWSSTDEVKIQSVVAGVPTDLITPVTYDFTAGEVYTVKVTDYLDRIAVTINDVEVASVTDSTWNTQHMLTLYLNGAGAYYDNFVVRGLPFPSFSTEAYESLDGMVAWLTFDEDFGAVRNLMEYGDCPFNGYVDHHVAGTSVGAERKRNQSVDISDENRQVCFPNFPLPQEFTFAGWVRPYAAESGDEYVLTDDAGMFTLFESGGTFQANTRRSAAVDSASSYDFNVWHYAAFGTDATNGFIQVDEDARVLQGPPNHTDDLEGVRMGDIVSGTNAYLDEWVLYDKAISEDLFDYLRNYGNGREYPAPAYKAAVGIGATRQPRAFLPTVGTARMMQLEAGGPYVFGPRNLMPDSLSDGQDGSGLGYNQSANIVITTSQTGPLGLPEAALLSAREDTGNGRCALGHVLTGDVLDGPGTFRVVAKRSGPIDHIHMTTYPLGGTDGDNSTWFDLSTGTIGTQEHTAARMLHLGSGWYLCEVDYDPDGATQVTASIGPTNGNGSTNCDLDAENGFLATRLHACLQRDAQTFVPGGTFGLRVCHVHDNGTVGTLIENWQRTNIHNYSENFGSTGFYNGLEGTKDEDGLTGPLTAYTLTDDESGQKSYSRSSVTVTTNSDAPVVSRFFVRKTTNVDQPWALIRQQLLSGSDPNLQNDWYLNPTTGQFNQHATKNDGIGAVQSRRINGLDWWEVVLATINNTNNPTLQSFLYPAVSDDGGVSEDNNFQGTVIGAQFEVYDLTQHNTIDEGLAQIIGAPPIVTNAGSLAQTAETVPVDPAILGAANADQGTFRLDFSTLSDFDGDIENNSTLLANNTSNRGLFRWNNRSAGSHHMAMSGQSGSVNVTTLGGTIQFQTPNALVCGWDADGMGMYVNGEKDEDVVDPNHGSTQFYIGSQGTHPTSRRVVRPWLLTRFEYYPVYIPATTCELFSSPVKPHPMLHGMTYAWSFDEIGTDLTDHVRKAKALAVSSPGSVAGPLGTASTFDGVNDYFDAFINMKRQYTAVMVLRAHTWTGDAHTPLDIGEADNALKFWLAGTEGDIDVRPTQDAAATINLSTDVRSGEWFLFAMGSNGFEGFARVNNEARQSVAGLSPDILRGVTCRIGKRNGAGDGFDGDIAQFLLFDRELRDGELDWLVNGGAFRQPEEILNTLPVAKTNLMDSDGYRDDADALAWWTTADSVTVENATGIDGQPGAALKITDNDFVDTSARLRMSADQFVGELTEGKFLGISRFVYGPELEHTLRFHQDTKQTGGQSINSYFTPSTGAIVSADSDGLTKDMGVLDLGDGWFLIWQATEVGDAPSSNELDNVDLYPAISPAGSATTDAALTGAITIDMQFAAEFDTLLEARRYFAQVKKPEFLASEDPQVPAPPAYTPPATGLTTLVAAWECREYDAEALDYYGDEPLTGVTLPEIHMGVLGLARYFGVSTNSRLANTNIPCGSSFSFECAVTFKTLGSTNAIRIRDSVDTGSYAEIYMSPSQSDMRTRNTGGSIDVTYRGTAFNDLEVHHCVITHDAGVTKAYIDGVEVGETSANPPDFSSGALYAEVVAGTGAHLLHFMRLYDGVLTADDVETLCNDRHMRAVEFITGNVPGPKPNLVPLDVFRNTDGLTGTSATVEAALPGYDYTSRAGIEVVDTSDVSFGRAQEDGSGEIPTTSGKFYAFAFVCRATDVLTAPMLYGQMGGNDISVWASHKTGEVQIQFSNTVEDGGVRLMREGWVLFYGGAVSTGSNVRDYYFAPSRWDPDTLGTDNTLQDGGVFDWMFVTEFDSLAEMHAFFANVDPRNISNMMRVPVGYTSPTLADKLGTLRHAWEFDDTRGHRSCRVTGNQLLDSGSDEWMTSGQKGSGVSFKGLVGSSSLAGAFGSVDLSGPFGIHARFRVDNPLNNSLYHLLNFFNASGHYLRIEQEATIQQISVRIWNGSTAVDTSLETFPDEPFDVFVWSDGSSTRLSINDGGQSSSANMTLPDLSSCALTVGDGLLGSCDFVRIYDDDTLSDANRRNEAYNLGRGYSYGELTNVNVGLKSNLFHKDAFGSLSGWQASGVGVTIQAVEGPDGAPETAFRCLDDGTMNFRTLKLDGTHEIQYDSVPNYVAGVVFMNVALMRRPGDGLSGFLYSGFRNITAVCSSNGDMAGNGVTSDQTLAKIARKASEFPGWDYVAVAVDTTGSGGSNDMEFNVYAGWNDDPEAGVTFQNAPRNPAHADIAKPWAGIFATTQEAIDYFDEATYANGKFKPPAGYIEPTITRREWATSGAGITISGTDDQLNRIATDTGADWHMAQGAVAMAPNTGVYEMVFRCAPGSGASTCAVGLSTSSTVIDDGGFLGAENYEIGFYNQSGSVWKNNAEQGPHELGISDSEHYLKLTYDSDNLKFKIQIEGNYESDWYDMPSDTYYWTCTGGLGAEYEMTPAYDFQGVGWDNPGDLAENYSFENVLTNDGTVQDLGTWTLEAGTETYTGGVGLDFDGSTRFTLTSGYQPAGYLPITVAGLFETDDDTTSMFIYAQGTFAFSCNTSFAVTFNKHPSGTEIFAVNNVVATGKKMAFVVVFEDNSTDVAIYLRDEDGVTTVVNADDPPLLESSAGTPHLGSGTANDFPMDGKVYCIRMGNFAATPAQANAMLDMLHNGEA